MGSRVVFGVTMRLYDTGLTRAEYLRTQVERSEAKFSYCKVSGADAKKYAEAIRRWSPHGGRPGGPGPIACLGTRNGREIDVFRAQFFRPWWFAALSRGLERRTHSFTTWCPPLERLGRSRLPALDAESVVGVELNPRAARPDVWIGSFDEMPEAWAGAFGVVYSNSFDQSEDPKRSAREWLRILRPGGYLVFCFSSDATPTISDPVGGLSLADVRDLFPGELVYFQHRGSRAGYSEVIIRVPGRP